MKRKYAIYKPNEWNRPVRNGFRLKCCDCGLVHVFDFRLVPYGRGHEIQFRLSIDARATAAVRRHLGTLSRAAEAASKVLRNPRSSKKVRIARGSALTQRTQ